MKRHRFAVRLSIEIILMTSVIFIVAVVILSKRGIDLSQKSSMNYTTQLLKTSVSKIESTIDAVEMAGKHISETVEATYNVGLMPDTTAFYRFIANTIADCPYILGAGVFYEPYVFDSKTEHAGIFVNRDTETGLTVNEWDDDAAVKEDGWDYLNQEWYSAASANGSPQWVPPFNEYSYFGTYEFVTSYTIPIRDSNGNVFAVCDVDLSLNWLQDLLKSMRPYERSNVIILDSNGNYICNPLSDTPYQGNVRDNPYLEGVEINSEGIGKWKFENFNGVKVIDFKAGNTWLYCVKTSLSNGWEMSMANYYDDAFADLMKIWYLVVVVIIVGLTLLFFACRGIIHFETRPIVKFAKAAGKITDGKFDVPIPEVKNKDEIHELGTALSFMQTSVTNYIEELKRTTSEKERLAGELDVARKIQMQMLSKDFPGMKGCGIFASSIPARQVGGDLYDFYVKGDNLFYIVGDVSGKGVPAALLMAISISAFRAAIRNDYTMSEIANVINNVFCRSNEDNMFITLNVGRINLKSMEFNVCNAGHNPMIVVSPDGNATYLSLKRNVACGVMQDFQYEEDALTLEKGSRLIIYTDGVTEAEDCLHNQFGTDRLLDFAGRHGESEEQSDEKVIADLSATLNGFVDGAEQFDDITMMSISF